MLKTIFPSKNRKNAEFLSW